LAIRQLLISPNPSWDPSNPSSVTEMTLFSMELTFAAQEVAEMTRFVRLRRDQVVQALGGTVSGLVASGIGMPMLPLGGDSSGEVQEDVMDFEGNNNTD
jgi:hypothetical protein